MTTQEIRSTFQIRKLDEGEIVSDFNCGDNDLNDFILNDAPHYREALLAVTYVLENRETHKVVAYFSLANDRISTDDFTSNSAYNRFKKKHFNRKKFFSSYPAAKLCRLGVDSSMKGQAIGHFLIDFIKTYFLMNNKTGCRFLTVDAYHVATPFYIKNGFQQLLLENPKPHTDFLYFDLKEME